MNQPSRPYSKLPEVYGLVAFAVWIDLIVAAYPGAPDGSLVMAAIVTGALLAGAAAHSWYVARPFVWERDRTAVPVSVFWLVISGVASLFVEAHSGWTMVGLLTYLQVAICSFVLGHRTLRLALASSLVVMLALTHRLPLLAAGTAWVLFASVAVFVLAYDRTARLAGPAGFARGERRNLGGRVGAVSAVALASAFFFTVTPMVGCIDLGFAGRSIMPSAGEPISGEAAEANGWGYGLSDATSALTEASSDVVVMTLETMPAVKGPLYVRGRTFDTFDGTNWARSRAISELSVALNAGEAPTPVTHAVRNESATTSHDVSQIYRMHVSLPEVVFSAGRPVSVQFFDRDFDEIYVAPDGAMRVGGVLRADSAYVVRGALDRFATDAPRRAPGQVQQQSRHSAEDLRIPRGLSPRVSDVARTVTKSGATPLAKARLLETHLRSTYRYSLEHEVDGPQVVEEFLFREKKGHCALFASAMVMMARGIGMPARYVTGFLAQNPGQDGFEIRGSDGHAWVEIYIEGRGWVEFDPTSPNEVPGEGLEREESGTPSAPPPNALDIAGLNGRDDMPQGGEPAGGSGRASGGQGGGSADPGLAGGPSGTGETGRGTAAEQNRAAQGREPANAGAGSQSSGPRVVQAPGGSTRIPRTESGAPMEAPADRGPVAPDPRKEASDWRWLVATLSGAGLLGLGFLFLWRRAVQPAIDREAVRAALPLAVEEHPDPRTFIVKLYHTMVTGFGKIGLVRREADTPTEFAAAVASREPRLEPAVGELTEIFQVARYDDATVTPADAARARDAWRRIARTVDRVHPAENDDEGPG